jgi:hypothetical protein
MESFYVIDHYTPLPLGYIKVVDEFKTQTYITCIENTIVKTYLITTYGYGGKLCFDTQTEKRFVDSRVGYANLIFKGTEYELGLYCDRLKTKIIGVEPLNTERKDAECSIVEVI